MQGNIVNREQGVAFDIPFREPGSGVHRLETLDEGQAIPSP